jgi:hypothetical protein
MQHHSNQFMPDIQYSKNSFILKVFSPMIIRTFLMVFFLTFTLKIYAQFNVDEQSGEDNYYSENFLRFDNHTYRDNVKTVLLHPKDWPIAAPFIVMNDPGSTLELHFDILDSALGNFMYEIIHCDYNWKKSALDVQEYIDGMPSDYLTDYDYSRNTFQKYIHYSLEIPNFNMQLTKSGNYLLKVFDYDNGDLILTRRFCVTENIVNVNARVKQATLVQQRYSHQEIDFSISTSNYQMTNPYSDLHVEILQNHTWENRLSGLEPRFVKESTLDYDYDGPNAMEGLNEYRLLDLKNTRFNGAGIASVTYTAHQNHAYLELDKSRASKTYLQNRDLNGWFYVSTNLSGPNSAALDADYVHAHFSLKQEKPLSDGDIYVYGALTDWKIIPEAKMKFNQLELKYENTLYVKQGIFNYMYAFVKDGELKPDIGRFEGSHFETENEYSILVYHRPLGLDYDRLLSIKTMTFPPEE